MAPKAEDKPKAEAATAKSPVKKESMKTEAPKTDKKLEPQEVALTTVLTRLSQQFNLLAILVVALFMFQAYTFYKLKNVETNGVVAGVGAGQGESPLSQESLVSYAKDLKLDTKKFEACLTNGDAKKTVEAESKEAAGLSVQGTPGFFINGRFLGGAFPYETFKEIIDKEIAGTASNDCKDYSEGMQQFCSDPNNLAFNPTPQKVALGDAPSRGPKNAKVTIVEFSDFECPFCQRAYGTVEQILKAYPKDVRLVYKQLPLTSLHPNAQRAAEASICAKSQGKFWEMYDKMFLAQGAAK